MRHKDWGTRCLELVLAVGVVLALPPTCTAAARVAEWNVTAVDATLIAGENPTVQSRALAVIQVAVHDALNAIDRRFEPYAFYGEVDPEASSDAAVATAAHDALVGVIAVGTLPFTGFGSADQQAAAVAFVDAAYAADLEMIPEGEAKTRGIAVGQAAAAAILAERREDGATTFVPYTPGTEPGEWQPTPNPLPPDPPAPTDHLPAQLPGWGQVIPFVLLSSNQFQPDDPPALTSERYALDYHEVQALGDKDSAVRTEDQEEIARFWFGSSPVGWSQIARTVAADRGLDAWEQAHLLALVNLAMADGVIAGFDTKYRVNWWRPITAIRAGETDGNEATVADPTWESLLNTPPHPDYVSTHSVQGGAVAVVLRQVFGTDQVDFTATSGVPFPGFMRMFTSFSAAAQENADSRVYAGVHFRSATTNGLKLGRQIGWFIVSHALRPVPEEDHADANGDAARR
jgi:PAP2 superfamily